MSVPDIHPPARKQKDIPLTWVILAHWRIRIFRWAQNGVEGTLLDGPKFGGPTFHRVIYGEAVEEARSEWSKSWCSVLEGMSFGPVREKVDKCPFGRVHLHPAVQIAFPAKSGNFAHFTATNWTRHLIDRSLLITCLISRSVSMSSVTSETKSYLQLGCSSISIAWGY